MRCPFLKEAQVKYCRASAFRKMIVRVPGQPDADLCTSSAYESCPVYKQHHPDLPGQSHCPYLQEALMQYCGAASVTKYIPYSEAALSPCGTESHKYCELFLSMAHPDRTHFHDPWDGVADVCEGSAEEFVVEGIRVPGWLYYSGNHMWADQGSEGKIHIGIDAFLAGMLGSIERILFVTPSGIHRPTVVLTVNGTDLQLVFPARVHITAVNSYLRSQPEVLLADPYARGWLFEGTCLNDAGTSTTAEGCPGLQTGANAAAWMREEVQRAARIAHEVSHTLDDQGVIAMADGGTAQPGFLRLLDREQMLQVFNEFFSPFAGRSTCS